jgi:hypothetical protein
MADGQRNLNRHAIYMAVGSGQLPDLGLLQLHFAAGERPADTASYRRSIGI